MQKTVQVVIKISEYIIDDIKECGFIPEEDSKELCKAIMNGIVLPKHGRLIDADELERNIDKFESILYHTLTILEATEVEE